LGQKMLASILEVNDETVPGNAVLTFGARVTFGSDSPIS
jgi:hypothetical protein